MSGWCVAAVLAVVLAPVDAKAGGDVALGEYLSGQCTTCHQISGKDNGIPSIVGWDQASFIAVMGSYKLKERENKAMQSIASSLSDEDIAALAAYFETIKPTGN
ncbi:MAG: c-type cytochrome [Pseudomonadota bacterium]